MSTVDKNKAIVDYLITCPQIYNTPLYFNFVNAKDSNKQIMTSANDSYANRKYVDGSVLRLYTFTILDFRSISDLAVVKLITQNNENIEDLSDVQGLIDWISEQNDLHNYPNFGEYCDIQSITTTTDTPSLDGINTELSPPLAVYSVTIRVEYIDTSKSIWR